MVFKLTFSDRMIFSFFLKFPCLECTWIHLKPFTFFKFQFPNFRQSLSNIGTKCIQNRTILWVMKSDICYQFLIMLSWRRKIYLVILRCFEKNRQLMGSCLYSLLLARDLFLRRLSPLFLSHLIHKSCCLLPSLRAMCGCPVT